MQTVLFHSTIFGPIHSRRLGVSLGVNLTPDDGKICTFDCLYCEAGFNAQGTGTTGLPPRETVARLLASRPSAKVSLLSNSTRIDRREVREALMKVDNNILKLDSAITDTIRLIDRPTLSNFTADKVIGELEKFGKDCIIQTMFLRGEHDGNPIDNTTPREVTALIEAYRRINPREVMIYSIDRTTPAEHLEKVSHDELNAIARRITSETGIPVQVA